MASGSAQALGIVIHSGFLDIYCDNPDFPCAMLKSVSKACMQSLMVAIHIFWKEYVYANPLAPRVWFAPKRFRNSIGHCGPTEAVVRASANSLRVGRLHQASISYESRTCDWRETKTKNLLGVVCIGNEFYKWRMCRPLRNWFSNSFTIKTNMCHDEWVTKVSVGHNLCQVLLLLYCICWICYWVWHMNLSFPFTVWGPVQMSWWVFVFDLVWARLW